MIDLHNHSEFSFDSTTPVEENILAAINKKLKYISITDHLDLITREDDYREIIDIPGYFDKVKLLKDKYKNDINILFGVEVGIQPETAKLNDIITSKFEYDFIIGSIHSLKEEDIYLANLIERYKPKELYQLYFEEMLKAVTETNNFDSLGHIDYMDRYYSSPEDVVPITEYKDLVMEILRTIIKKGKGFEINTAGIRAGLSYMHPQTIVLDWYKDLGGDIITIGSDAHRKEDIGFGVFEACDLLESYGFNGIYVFEKREPKKLYFK